MDYNDIMQAINDYENLVITEEELEEILQELTLLEIIDLGL